MRSVSVEFECVDKIYEENIKRGFIKDAAGDFTWLVEKLKDEKEIVIIGTGVQSLNAYIRVGFFSNILKKWKVFHI